jgi:excisionase family DNA binding protein
MEEKGTNGKKVLTVKEVSEYLRIPMSTIYWLAKKGELRGVKFGKHWRFLEAEILNYFTNPRI